MRMNGFVFVFDVEWRFETLLVGFFNLWWHFDLSMFYFFLTKHSAKQTAFCVSFRINTTKTFCLIKQYFERLVHEGVNVVSEIDLSTPCIFLRSFFSFVWSWWRLNISLYFSVCGLSTVVICRVHFKPWCPPQPLPATPQSEEHTELSYSARGIDSHEPQRPLRHMRIYVTCR